MKFLITVTRDEGGMFNAVAYVTTQKESTLLTAGSELTPTPAQPVKWIIRLC